MLLIMILLKVKNLELQVDGKLCMYMLAEIHTKAFGNQTASIWTLALYSGVPGV